MRPQVVVPLSAADVERERPNLERGSVVAHGVKGLAIGAFCDVELVFPSGERMGVPARAVMTTDAGTVFAFDGFDRAALGRHLAACALPAEIAPEPPAARAPESAGVGVGAGVGAGAGAETGAATGPDTGAGENAEAAVGAAEAAEEPARSDSVPERLRGLSVVEQLRVAREGTLEERVVLERLYGKTVWEALLRNTRVTVPEVARLAKLGTLPRTLLELIVGNPAWLQVPQVRRALLSNPRVSQEMIAKVLGLTPREELKLMPQNTAYPPAVRMAAKALLKR